MSQIDLEGEEGQVAVELPHIIGQKSFVSGEDDPGRFRVRYFTSGDGKLVARVWFGQGTSGPPRHAHGGSQAAVLDEVMGSTAWMNGLPVLAGELTVSFRAMLPLDTLATATGWIEHIEGRKVTIRGTLVGPDGTLYSEGRGLFIKIDPARAGQGPQQAADDFAARVRAALDARP